jgi:hypothetical protein
MNYTLQVHELRPFQLVELDFVRGLWYNEVWEPLPFVPIVPLPELLTATEALQIFHKNHHAHATSIYMFILLVSP